MRLHYYDGCVVWYVYSDVWLVCMDTSGSVLATLSCACTCDEWREGVGGERV